jgi:hypothetical protein
MIKLFLKDNKKKHRKELGSRFLGFFQYLTTEFVVAEKFKVRSTVEKGVLFIFM